MESIPPEALSELQAVQIATMKGLKGLTEEQFAEIPVATFEGLTDHNMADFTIEVINKFTPKHVDNLNRKSFKKMSSKRTSKVLVHFDSEQISLEQAKELLPDDWQLDMKTGALTPPIGAKFTPPLLADKSSEQVSLPTMANIGLGVGVGGLGDSIENEMENALEEEDLTDFVLSQEDSGILKFESTDEEIQYAFILDADNAIQVDTDKIPVGLSIGNGGFYTITTPNGQQYRVIPSPKDPTALVDKVTIGKSGDVMLQLTTKTRNTNTFQILMFDQFVEPAPEDWCLETDDGEIICDFDNAPADMQPGIHWPRERAKLKLPKAKVVYPDGRLQQVTPTVYDPNIFIEEGLKIAGVERLTFNVNGTFYLLYEGNSYIISPTFTVKTAKTTSDPYVSIAINEDGKLNYSIPVELSGKTRSNSQMMLLFDLFIEPAPEDWYLEADDGGVFCDFDNIPEF